MVICHIFIVLYDVIRIYALVFIIALHSPLHCSIDLYILLKEVLIKDL